MGTRRRSREAALQLLFQLDVTHQSAEESIGEFLNNFDIPEEVRPFTVDLVMGVFRNRAELDGIIQKHSQHWRVVRMSGVDRNTLRMAVYELMYLDVPSRAVINEAIELGKKFGTEESGAFVNGVLDAIAQSLGKVDKAPSDPEEL
ncbi:MAG: transcription antitermination factor NusB [Deltaproteobacteria bacterium]|nr:transcription antitermination factor NusB [Deltaproteobacteria bacterium]